MKIKKTIYWIVGIVVMLGWTDLVWGETPSSIKRIIKQNRPIQPAGKYGLFVTVFGTGIAPPVLDILNR